MIGQVDWSFAYSSCNIVVVFGFTFLNLVGEKITLNVCTQYMDCTYSWKDEARKSRAASKLYASYVNPWSEIN